MNDSLLYSTNMADLSDHIFVVHAAILLGNTRQLYREAWRLRRIMFRHARDRVSYDHYYYKLQNIKNSGEIGAKCVKQIEAVAHQVLQ